MASWNEMKSMEVESKEHATDELMEATDSAPKTELVPDCSSARSSASFNISRLSSPFHLNMPPSSTPIKHPEVKNQVETSNFHDQKENSTITSNKNQSLSVIEAKHPQSSSTVLTPVINNSYNDMVSLRTPNFDLLNTRGQNLPCHSGPVDDSTANKGTAERNPFFHYDHSGNIMFMDTSSPPLECIDRMLNSFNYDPSRPKYTGFVSSPKKIKPLFSQTADSEIAITESDPANSNSVKSGSATEVAQRNESKLSLKTNDGVSKESTYASVNSTVYYSLPFTRHSAAHSCEVSSNNAFMTALDMPSCSAATRRDMLCTPRTSKGKNLLETILDEELTDLLPVSANQSEDFRNNSKGAGETVTPLRNFPTLPFAEVSDMELFTSPSEALSKVTPGGLDSSIPDEKLTDLLPVSANQSEDFRNNSKGAGETVTPLRNFPTLPFAEVSDMELFTSPSEALFKVTPAGLDSSILDEEPIDLLPVIGNQSKDLKNNSGSAGEIMTIPLGSAPTVACAEVSVVEPFTSPSEALSQVTPGSLCSSTLDEELTDLLPVIANQSENSENISKSQDETVVPSLSSTMQDTFVNDLTAPSTSGTTSGVTHTTGLSKIPRKATRKSRRLSIRLGKPSVVSGKSNAFGKMQKTDGPQRLIGRSLRLTSTKVMSKNPIQTEKETPSSIIPTATLVAAGLMKNSYRRNVEMQEAAAKNSVPGTSCSSSIPQQSKSGANIPKTRTIAQRTDVKQSTINASRLGSYSSVTTASSLKPSTGKQVLPRQSLAPRTGIANQSRPTLPRQSNIRPLTQGRNALRQSTVVPKTGISASVTRGGAPRQSTVVPKTGISASAIRGGTPRQSILPKTGTKASGPSVIRSNMQGQSIAKTGVAVAPRTNLRQLRPPTNIHLAGAAVQKTSLKPSTSRPVSRRTMAPNSDKNNNVSSDPMKPSISKSHVSTGKSLVQKSASKTVNRSDANSSTPSSSTSRSGVAVKKPLAVAQNSGDSELPLAPTSGLSTNPTPELLMITEEGS